MRFHVVAMPHTQTSMKHSACAFTTKVLKFCKMMSSLGHQVYHYGAENSEVSDYCVEDIQIISAKEQESFFGPSNPDKLYTLEWEGKSPYWYITNSRAITEINKRKRQGDFVCVIMGRLNEPIAQGVGQSVLTVEYGIGYNGPMPRAPGRFRIYESYAHMHKLWGVEGGYDPDGHLYDAVIPNYFDPNDYKYSSKKQDYFLYLGRLVQRKGINIAVEACKKLGFKLKIAGPGCDKVVGNKIHCTDGSVYEGEYVGVAMGEKRSELFRNARATFVPTTYIEPFGGVAVESQLAGTPVITTDFGAFPETVEHGKTGFRCSTLNDFVQAARAVDQLNYLYIHKRAVQLYSMDNVRYQFDTYFHRLQDLWAQGWYTLRNNPDERWLKGYK